MRSVSADIGKLRSVPQQNFLIRRDNAISSVICPRLSSWYRGDVFGRIGQVNENATSPPAFCLQYLFK